MDIFIVDIRGGRQKVSRGYELSGVGRRERLTRPLKPDPDAPPVGPGHPRRQPADVDGLPSENLWPMPAPVTAPVIPTACPEAHPYRKPDEAPSLDIGSLASRSNRARSSRGRISSSPPEPSHGEIGCRNSSDESDSRFVRGIRERCSHPDAAPHQVFLLRGGHGCGDPEEAQQQQGTTEAHGAMLPRIRLRVPPCLGRYWLRRARIGSIVAARRAGSALAASATSVRITGTTMNVRVSWAPTP
jgi:hypothetical protein